MTGAKGPGPDPPIDVVAAVDAAGIGVFDWDVTSNTMIWDQRLTELFGVEAQAFSAVRTDLLARVHPADARRVDQAVDAALQTCGDYSDRYRIVRPDGAIRWVVARGQVVSDERGSARRLVGCAYDATSLVDVDAAIARVLEEMPTAFVTMDREGQIVYLNATAESLLGATRAELVGVHALRAFPRLARALLGGEFGKAVRQGHPTISTMRFPEPLDGWYEIQAWPGPQGISLYLTDVGERVRIQNELTAAMRGARVRARVATELAKTLDADEAIARLAPILVPEIGDWCVLSLVDETSGGQHNLRDVAVRHVDYSQHRLVSEYAADRLKSLTPGSFLGKALRTGEPVVARSSDGDRSTDALHPGTALTTLETLDPGSAILMPLRGRGRTVGAISLFRTQERAPFSDPDLDLMRDVASRAGLAIDNAQLYRTQRHISEELQRSMLSGVPDVDSIELAVRYAPASHVANVGGDWYDVFARPDGSTVLVIGDVVGHDVRAAADMGQARALLRGIGVTIQAAPGLLLDEVDRALQNLDTGVIATAVVARVKPTRSEGGLNLEWSSAGHLPPVLIRTNGSAHLLGTTTHDPLLGILPPRTRSTRTSHLRPGEILFMYTDGLVERREESVQVGIQRLLATFNGLSAPGMALEPLCDLVVDAMAPDDRHDDIALLAIRSL